MIEQEHSAGWGPGGMVLLCRACSVVFDFGLVWFVIFSEF